MFKWCMHCQKFIYETQPYQGYSASYRICESCYYSPDFRLDAKSICQHGLIKSQIRQATKSRNVRELDVLLETALQAGERPIDLLFEVLLSCLSNTSEPWKSNKPSLSDEHIFTSYSTLLVEMLFSKFPARSHLRQSDSPEVVLIPVEGNAQILALQMLEFLLLTEEIPSYVVSPCVSPKTVRDLVQRMAPQVVKISASLLSQLPAVIDTINAVRDIPLINQPSIVLGGQLVRRPNFEAAQFEELGVTLATSLQDILCALQLKKNRAARNKKEGWLE